MKPYIAVPLYAGLILVSIFAFEVTKQGERDMSDLETIQGIPFPASSGAVQVSESLAHADIYLAEPVFAKKIALTIKFHPGNVKSLKVGVRENDFWLSYPWLTVWENGEKTDWQERTIEIPLSDKLQETDRSVDVMFFAEGREAVDSENTAAHTVQWQLTTLEASVHPAVPTLPQAKDYVRSIINRERAL